VSESRARLTSLPYGRWLAPLAFLLASAVASAQCDLSADPVTLAIEGFGTAYFQEFEADPVADRVELTGDVCIVALSGEWTITGDRASITGLRTQATLHARITAPAIAFDGWRVLARILESNGTALSLVDVTFEGNGVVGSADRLEMDAEAGNPKAEAVRVSGSNFRLQADRAHLVGNDVDLWGVAITTCTCRGTPFYEITGTDARLDLDRQRLTVGNGRLAVAGLAVPLAERLELSAASLQRLSPPVTLEYRPEPGTGLGVVVPDLEVEKGLALELGVLGLDAANPLQGYALARYRQENVSFTVGRARGGPRADFDIVQSVTAHLDASFSIRNRHEAASHYLHEGKLQLGASPAPIGLGPAGTLELRGIAFAAVSAQEPPGGPVMSPRLGVEAGFEARTPTGPGSTLALAMEGNYTAYPAREASQVGLSLKPSWHYDGEPFGFGVTLDRLWTDSGSPFSTKLDRLTPRHRLSAQASLAGPLGGGADGSARVDFAYDLLRLGGVPVAGLERLGAGFGLTYPLGDWTVALQTRLELAGLLDPDADGDRKGFFQAGVTGRQGAWEAGTSFRYGLRPGEEGVELVEASLAVPLRLEDVTLTPFVALDFVPLLFRGEPPSVSGHGLELTWVSCCGTVSLGYRQHDSSFATSFGLSLEH
jgi:hypothetical protein